MPPLALVLPPFHIQLITCSAVERFLPARTKELCTHHLLDGYKHNLSICWFHFSHSCRFCFGIWDWRYSWTDIRLEICISDLRWELPGLWLNLHQVYLEWLLHYCFGNWRILGEERLKGKSTRKFHGWRWVHHWVLLIAKALKSLAKNKTYIVIAIGNILATFTLGGLGDWLPAFLHRQLGIDVAQAGVYTVRECKNLHSCMAGCCYSHWRNCRDSTGRVCSR